MSRPRFPVVPLHRMEPGQWADTFALLAALVPGTTRDGKPFFACRFRDRRRELEARVWADSPCFPDCQAAAAGAAYKLRAVVREHEKYGAQLDLQQMRPVQDADAADGYSEADLRDVSRTPPAELFAELKALLAAEIADEPLRGLVLGLLDTQREPLLKLPATPRHYYPFPGGWLEHTLSVTQACVWLGDRYRSYYAELSPPLNRDVLLAGAALHEIGRVRELEFSADPLAAPEPGVDGQLFGHHLLGRDLIRDAARSVEGLDPELVRLLEHLVLSYLTRPEWGSPRLPQIPEALVLHHADDLDAKMEMYVRCLTRDPSPGPFTEPDAVLKKPLWKGRRM